VPETTYPTGAAKILRDEASKLEIRSKQQAELGDHHTAHQSSADALKLLLKASMAEGQEKIRDGTSGWGVETEEGSDREPEPKVYKPTVDYIYKDGTVRHILAGWYTESEHLARSMEEQELWTAVSKITGTDRAFS
jgi:hypothetical protein